MCAPGKSRRGIGGVLRKLFTYSNKLKAPSVAAFCFAVAGAVLTIIGPSLLSRITDLISDALDGEIDLAAIGRTGVILLVIYGFSAVFTYVEHFIMATVPGAVPGYAAGPVPKNQPGAHELLQQGVLW